MSVEWELDDGLHLGWERGLMLGWGVGGCMGGRVGLGGGGVGWVCGGECVVAEEGLVASFFESCLFKVSAFPSPPS